METLGELEKSKVVVENSLNADEVTIPFFCDPRATIRERRPCGAAQNALDFRPSCAPADGILEVERLWPCITCDAAGAASFEATRQKRGSSHQRQ